MATTKDGVGLYVQESRQFEKCRVVAVDFASLTDAETYQAGPGLLTCAWEVLTTGTGIGGWLTTARADGGAGNGGNTLEWDSAGAAQAGTLYLFYGTNSGGR